MMLFLVSALTGMFKHPACGGLAYAWTYVMLLHLQSCCFVVVFPSAPPVSTTCF
jgi:hypothetical protein